ncbi:Uncharacterised protein [Halioglobus japonicus]|nr:Uncharacterised protein [Halioglobus japonicus]
MKLLQRAATLCVFSVMSAAAVAIPTDYTFDIAFTSGGPAAPVPVFVTLDGVTGIGIELFRPDINNLLSFDFTLFNKVFEMTDDTSFPSLPLVQLEDGALTGLGFMGRKSELGGRISSTVAIDFTDQVNSVLYGVVSPGQANFAFGAVASETWRSLTPPVPVPGTLALFSLGLASLGMRRRKAAPNTP